MSKKIMDNIFQKNNESNIVACLLKYYSYACIEPKALLGWRGLGHQDLVTINELYP